MSIPGMAASMMRPRQPSFLILFVTSKCNAGCSFCFYADRISSDEPDGSELTTAEMEKISLKCGNIPYLLLSGGEPILREDLADVTGFFIRNARARYVTIPSNGLLPGRSEALFETLTRMHPKVHFRAVLSVDFPDSRHDEMRQRKGCLDLITETGSRLGSLRNSRKNLSLDVVSVFMPENAELHPELREWVRNAIGPDNHELHVLRSKWPAAVAEGVNPELFLRQLKEYRRTGRKRETRYLSFFFRGLNNLYIKSMKRLMRGDRISACFAGRKITVIDETGNVRLCELRPEALGSLREHGYDLHSILSLKSSTELMRKMNDEGCTCTWECAVSTNIVSSFRFYPSLIMNSFCELFRAEGEK